MVSTTSDLPTHTENDSDLVTYPQFLWECVRISFAPGPLFYTWMSILTVVALVGANAWANQTAEGMILTNMTDHVSWGLYIANFTFAVGLAAGGVMMVIPAYLYEDREMHEVVIVGELLAVAAIVVSLAFVIVDMGRPDRLWHLIPGLGRFNFPMSMLTWDVIVLNGYLLLNLHVTGYMLYSRFIGKRLNPVWYMPFVFVSVAWAISIHTVTAFLYQGLGSRPFWNDAIIAPRFLASAFVTGPAFLIVTLSMLRRIHRLEIPQGAVDTLTSILRVTVCLNLFLVFAEVFTQFYTGGSHAASASYLYFGLHGKSGLVPWIWSAIALNVVATVILLTPLSRRGEGWILAACLMTFVGVWIEKGMGMIVPAFVPSTLHELVEYSPSLTEWRLTAGIWAMGAGIFTISIRVAGRVLTGRSRLGSRRTA